MPTDHEIQTLKDQAMGYQKVTYEVPGGNRWHETEGWVSSAYLPDTEVPIVIVVESDGIRRIPVSRVIETFSTDPPSNA